MPLVCVTTYKVFIIKQQKGLGPQISPKKMSADLLKFLNVFTAGFNLVLHYSGRS